MKKSSALIDSLDKIEELLNLLLINEPLIYIIVAYVYYFGYSQDEVIGYISRNHTFPTKNKRGVPLELNNYPRLISLLNIFNFECFSVNRGSLYRILKHYGSECGINNVCMVALRKTWAFNEVCKGTDFPTIKHQISYKGSILQFFDYLGVGYDDIINNEHLKILYFRGLTSCLASRTPESIPEFALRELRDFIS